MRVRRRTHQRPQVGDRERIGERIDAEPSQLGHLDGGVVGVEHHHLAERARVDEQQLGRPVAVRREVHHHVGVRRARRRRIGEQQLAAHAQVHHHGVAACRAAPPGTCRAGRRR